MSFEFVLIAFATRGSPPRGITMRNARKDYFFAPLCHDGLIYTADLGLWSKAEVVTDRDSQVFCPQKQDILSALSRAQSENWPFLMALTEHREFDTPGPPSARLFLESASNFTRETKAIGLIGLGFDVVDQWTGLSVLVNVGYSSVDVLALKKLELRTNQFGLFDHVDDSLKFIEFAQDVVPEHAPFLPLKVFCSSSAMRE